MTDKTGSPKSATIESAKQEMLGLIGDVRGLAESEIAYYKARFDFTRRHVQRALVFAGLALLLVLCFFIAITVGALLILAEWIGILFATLVLCAALLLITALLGLMIRGQVRKIRDLTRH